MVLIKFKANFSYQVFYLLNGYLSMTIFIANPMKIWEYIKK